MKKSCNKLVLVYKNKNIEIDDRNLIEVVERYSDLIDVIENSSKIGYLAMLCKQKPEYKELVNSKLMQAKKDCDWHLRKVKSISSRYTGYYFKDIPNGIKE